MNIAIVPHLVWYKCVIKNEFHSNLMDLECTRDVTMVTGDLRSCAVISVASERQKVDHHST